MPNLAKLTIPFSLFLMVFVCLTHLQAAPKPTTDATQVPIPTIQPKGQSYTKALIIHKPMPDPAWGKVIQYHSELTTDVETKTKGTLYTFVFQDDKGVVRIANYHEDENGEGYWEVYLWDLP